MPHIRIVETEFGVSTETVVDPTPVEEPKSEEKPKGLEAINLPPKPTVASSFAEQVNELHLCDKCDFKARSSAGLSAHVRFNHAG